MFNDSKMAILNELMLIKHTVYLSFDRLITRITNKYSQKLNIGENEMKTVV